MTLRIDDFIWIDKLADKIIVKHGVEPDEVESALLNTDPMPYVWSESDRYLALAQVEDDGEYIFVVFVMEPGSKAKIITARPMDAGEKRKFRKVRKQG